MKRTRLVSVLVALTAGLLLAACGGSSPSASNGGGSGNGGGGGGGSTPAPTATTPPATSGSGSSSQYMQVNAASKSVTITLDITGFNFDGDSNGKMTVSVPEGWSVTMDCDNKSTIPHSCAVVQGASSTTPEFTGAETTNPLTGLQPGSSANFTFTASTTGNYRIGCLVPGHMAAGMWDNFNVTSGGSPSIST